MLLSYENEAIAAKQGGQDLDYVVPDSTILIENPAAVTNGRRRGRQGQGVPGLRPVAARPAGLRRPRLPPGHRRHQPARRLHLPDAARPFTIDDLGGWTEVATKFFDQTNGIVDPDRSRASESTPERRKLAASGDPSRARPGLDSSARLRPGAGSDRPRHRRRLSRAHRASSRSRRSSLHAARRRA